MENTTVHIKNMVCGRCIKSVTEIFKTLDIPTEDIQLGEVKLRHPLSKEQQSQLSEKLELEGFERIDDYHSSLISAIKNAIISLVHYKDLSAFNKNISQYLTEKLNKDYHYLSKLFSASENTTIEKFVINQKIEKAKELLVYDELTLNEIAIQLGYSSSAHLSGQFKRATGFNPSEFKKLKHHSRKSLDQI